MGMMNLCYFRDADTGKLGNIFEENDIQSHYSPAGYMTFKPIAEGFSGNGRARSERLKAHLEDKSISGYLTVTHPHHTSQKGVLIIATDYMVDLCIHRLPESCESFESALAALTRDYRKDLMRYRHSIGRDHELVTKKTLVSERPELIVEHGTENAVPGQNVGHLVGMNFDHIHEDIKDKRNNAAKDISEAYHSLVEVSESNAPYPVNSMRFGPLSKYQSLIHWASLTESDVVIVEYDHLTPARLFKGDRETRNTPDTLLRQIKDMPSQTISESMHLKEYVLMKEFFASQGILINL